MPKIIDAHYELGNKAYASGATLRSIVETIQEADLDDDVSTARALSFAIGFLDGLLTEARRPLVIAEPGPLVR
ncbi:MAG: hypothetical protein AB7U62_09300 [Pseudolabrys sp.]